MRLAFATVRYRWPSFAGAFVALALGVALLTATLAVFASAQPAVPDRYAGAPVVVRAPIAGERDDPFATSRPWLPEQAGALVHRLGAIPQVRAAVPDHSFYAQLVRAGRPLGDPLPGDHLGHAWSVARLAPYRLTAGAPPSGEGEVALDQAYGIAPGERVTVLTAAGPVRRTVTGTLDGPGIYVSDAVAARLAGGVTAIGLLTAPEADLQSVVGAARAAVGDSGRVLTGDARAELEPVSYARTRWIGAQLLTVMATIAAFAAVFVVGATFSLAAHQRRRELALLRAVGALPGQVRRLMLGEALLVGAVAAVAGAGLGGAGAPLLGAQLVRAGMEPPGFTVQLAPLAVAGAIGIGLSVALLAVWAAARRAARISPLAALRDAEVDQRPMTRLRWVLGSVCMVAGVGLAMATAGLEGGSAVTAAVCSALTLIAGLAILAPVVVPPVARAVTLPMGRRAGGAIGLLVRQNAVVAVRRTAATAAPVLLTVGFATLILGMVATAAVAFGDERADRAGAEVVVTPDQTPGLSDAAVAAVPGETAALLPSTVYLPGPGRAPVALAAAGVEGVEGVDGVDGVEGVDGVGGVGGGVAEGTVAVPAAAAATHGWVEGGTVRLRLADGRSMVFRIAAIVDGEGPVLLDRDTVRAHDPSALTELVYADGVETATVQAAVAGLGATATDAATYAADDEEDRLAWLFALIMVGLSVTYTGIAVANTVMMATAGRRRDFAVLRRCGATTGQVLRMVGTETVLVVGVGTVLGALVALPALLGIRSSLAEAVDRPVPLLLPWPPILAVVGACVVLALTAGLASAVLAQGRSGPAAAGS